MGKSPDFQVGLSRERLLNSAGSSGSNKSLLRTPWLGGARVPHYHSPLISIKSVEMVVTTAARHWCREAGE